MYYNLKFKDPSRESKFFESKFKFQTVVIKIISLIGILYRLALISVSNRTVALSTIPLTMTIIFFFSQIISLLLVKYKPHSAEKTLVVLILINLVTMFEYYMVSRETWNCTLYFLFGSQIGTQLFCLLVGRIRWTYTCFLMIFMILVYNLRYIDYQIQRDMNYFPLVGSIIYFWKIIVSSYFLERTDRYRFQEKMDYELTMDSFKHFIKEGLPSGVMILHKKKLLFRNSAYKHILKTEPGGSDLECTKKIILEQNLYRRSLKETKFKAGDLKKSCDILDQTLFDVLSDEEQISKHNEEYSEFQGWLEIDTVNDEPQKTYFDIKIGRILWERKLATVILISENPMILKLNYLKTQAIYKDKLLATVSHDLRTPLNGIMGMIQASMFYNIPYECRKSLQTAHRSSYLLLHFVNDILDYSQIIHGTLRLAFTSFSIGASLKEVCKLIKFQAKNKGLKFIFQDESLNDCCDGTVSSDPNRLKQVVLNLLGNSLKFTSAGFIRLSVKALPNSLGEAPSPKSYLIEVEDSGCGIKKENIQNLFRVFGKIDDSPNPIANETGVGLGLSISQNLVGYLNNHQQGMDIKVWSEVGRGSRFYFTLISQETSEADLLQFNSSSLSLIIPDERQTLLQPLLLEPSSNSHMPFIKSSKYESNILPQQLNQDLNLSSLRVLVVDDDQINILVFSSYLKTLGVADFRVAFNGQEALDIIFKRAQEGYFYNIILMDCNMPIMDGFEATKNICCMIRDGIIPPTPIIAATANASPNDYQECFKAGMSEFLSKPFTLDKLREVLIRMLKK